MFNILIKYLFILVLMEKLAIFFIFIKLLFFIECRLLKLSSESNEQPFEKNQFTSSLKVLIVINLILKFFN